MKPLYVDIMPPKLLKALKKLGSDISIARRKRHLSMDMMCERAGVSKQTYQRMERGDPSVSLGVLAMTLFALGEEHRLQKLLDVATDDVGLLNDISNLPTRIRRPK
jgi:transcriptional regulator with XRE-family HTH domain